MRFPTPPSVASMSPRRRVLRSAFGLVLLLPLGTALAQTAIERSFEVAEGARVQVHNLKGSIRIESVAGSTLRLSGELGDRAELKVDQGTRSLSLRIDYPSSGWGWGRSGGGGDTHLRIEIPGGLEIAVSAVSADIEVEGVAGPRLELESVSGRVQARAFEVARLQASTVSGSLEANGRADRVELESVSGSVSYRGSASEQIKAEAVSGAVDVGLEDSAPREIRLETVSGSVRFAGLPAPDGLLQAETLSGRLRIELDPATRGELQVSTFSGRIQSDVGEVERPRHGPGASLRTRLGDGEGGTRIQLESFSGSVEIRSGR